MLKPVFSHLLNSPMFITREALHAFLGDVFFSDKIQVVKLLDYEKFVQEECKTLAMGVNDEKIKLTADYYDTEQEDSIAFYRIKGTIHGDSEWPWYFSSKRFRSELLAAEDNPSIISHFISMNSGGGDAWYLDIVADTMKKLKKPVVAHVERVAASAGLYLIMNADKVYSSTAMDKIGSVGTMISFLDIIPYFESMGIKHIEEHASQSTLKNKRFNDLLDGKPEEFIKKELDPIAQAFINDVKISKRKLKLDDNHDLYKGETYRADEAIALGLINDIMLVEEAVAVAHDMGMKKKKPANYSRIFNSISEK